VAPVWDGANLCASLPFAFQYRRLRGGFICLLKANKTGAVDLHEYYCCGLARSNILTACQKNLIRDLQALAHLNAEISQIMLAISYHLFEIIPGQA
jgi:hypothetical protein